VLNSLRVKFIRGEEVKYISHLDLTKVFERALRRSGIPVSYSQGFNPHPGMVFGLPLSVGVTSEAEYADFDLDKAIAPDEFIKRLNDQLPKGLRLVDAKQKKTKTNIMASVARASYDVLISCAKDTSLDELRTHIEHFMKRQEIIVEKKAKKGNKDIDIRPMIHKIDVSSANVAVGECSANENLFRISMLLSAGSKSNLKPELMLTALSDMAEKRIKIKRIHRTGLLVEKEGKILDPIDACD